jgi:hypothetical protein
MFRMYRALEVIAIGFPSGNLGSQNRSIFKATIVAYDLEQPIVIGRETQHGFLLSTRPCSPSWSVNNHENKNASFFIKLNPVESTQNPFRN